MDEQEARQEARLLALVEVRADALRAAKRDRNAAIRAAVDAGIAHVRIGEAAAVLSPSAVRKIAAEVPR